MPDFGKHALTIWICYGVSIAVILAFSLQTIKESKKWKNKN